MITEIKNNTDIEIFNPIPNLKAIIVDGTITGEFQVLLYEGLQDGIYFAGQTRPTIKEAINEWNKLWVKINEN